MLHTPLRDGGCTAEVIFFMSFVFVGLPIRSLFSTTKRHNETDKLT
jgi:hypothetical protein